MDKQIINAAENMCSGSGYTLNKLLQHTTCDEELGRQEQSYQGSEWKSVGKDSAEPYSILHINNEQRVKEAARRLRQSVSNFHRGEAVRMDGSAYEFFEKTKINFDMDIPLAITHPSNSQPVRTQHKSPTLSTKRQQFVLVEHIERHPHVLTRPGMACTIVPHRSIDTVPKGVHCGSTSPIILFNSLYASQLYSHRPHPRDFLLVSTKSSTGIKFTIRKLPSKGLLSGHTQQRCQIPSPDDDEYRALVKKHVGWYLLKLGSKMRIVNIQKNDLVALQGNKYLNQVAMGLLSDESFVHLLQQYVHKTVTQVPTNWLPSPEEVCIRSAAAVFAASIDSLKLRDDVTMKALALLQSLNHRKKLVEDIKGFWNTAPWSSGNSRFLELAMYVLSKSELAIFSRRDTVVAGSDTTLLKKYYSAEEIKKLSAAEKRSRADAIRNSRGGKTSSLTVAELFEREAAILTTPIPLVNHHMADESDDDVIDDLLPSEYESWKLTKTPLKSTIVYVDELIDREKYTLWHSYSSHNPTKNNESAKPQKKKSKKSTEDTADIKRPKAARKRSKPGSKKGR